MGEIVIPEKKNIYIYIYILKGAAFSPIVVCFGGEQNREGYGPQSGQYLHNWGKIVTVCDHKKIS